MQPLLVMSRHPLNVCFPSPILMPPGKKAIKLRLKISYLSTFMRYLEEANLQKKKVDYRLLGAGGGVGRSRELLVDGYRVSVWDDEKVLEMDIVDSCTIL